MLLVDGLSSEKMRIALGVGLTLAESADLHAQHLQNVIIPEAVMGGETVFKIDFVSAGTVRIPAISNALLLTHAP